MMETRVRAGRRARRLVALAGGGLPSAVVLAAGCQEPSYRYVTVPNGEGGVELRREPKTPPAEQPTPPPVAATAPPATSPPTAPPAPAAQERIDAPEAQVRELKAEMERMKRRPPATAPATS